MAARKQYPLRIDPEVWAAVERWAADEMRSANGQVEWILRDALRRAGRLPGGRAAVLLFFFFFPSFFFFFSFIPSPPPPPP